MLRPVVVVTMVVTPMCISLLEKTYYDVHSLYPFAMKAFPMPIGAAAKWVGNLQGQKLEDLYGFIEAYVICPESIKNPVLPYRDEKSGVLLFPTGTFIGVYYSEELKYAQSIGYTVKRYLYERPI
uniref:DNA-directed DNA polymerase n=1 Tax=Utricularia reniformis TaxID=192314 RepID=A0A1Y0B148_9LAMI|nr:hypothetical protein AEK19_MT0150 [Utricularia reniformis]ART31176.1 hypothetical protein AEK19_MT0150 [Utricularia reniformis]